MSVQAELQDLGFVRAGAIRPYGGGQSCRADVERDEQGFIVYAHVVGNEIKKFGTTTPRLKPRVHQNASTINGCIALLDGRPVRDAGWHHRPFDAFKRLAPLVIKSQQEIEIWAIKSTAGDYKTLEQQLNAKYDTLRRGWAIRLG